MNFFIFLHSLSGEYDDTFGTLRQVLVQKTIIRKMLKNGGAVDDGSDDMSEKLSTENLNYLVSCIW